MIIDLRLGKEITNFNAKEEKKQEVFQKKQLDMNKYIDTNDKEFLQEIFSTF